MSNDNDESTCIITTHHNALLQNVITQYEQDKVINETQAKNLINEVEHLKAELQLAENDLLQAKKDTNNFMYEYDNCQIELDNEKTVSAKLLADLKNIKVRYAKLQEDSHEADKASTKKQNRLLEKMSGIEIKYEVLQKQFRIVKHDLNIINLLCSSCDKGVKSIKCMNCSEKLCRSCFEIVDLCTSCEKSHKDLIP